MRRAHRARLLGFLGMQPNSSEGPELRHFTARQAPRQCVMNYQLCDCRPDDELLHELQCKQHIIWCNGGDARTRRRSKN